MENISFFVMFNVFKLKTLRKAYLEMLKKWI